MDFFTVAERTFVGEFFIHRRERQYRRRKTRNSKFHRRFDRYRRRTEFSPTISLLATVNFSFHRRFSLSTARPIFHRRFPHPNVRNHINPPSIRTKTNKKRRTRRNGRVLSFYKLSLKFLTTSMSASLSLFVSSHSSSISSIVLKLAYSNPAASKFSFSTSSS